MSSVGLASLRAPAAGVALASVVGVLWTQHYQREKQDRLQARQARIKTHGKLKSKRRTRVKVDKVFFEKVKKLVKIVIPHWKSKPFWFLSAHTLTLLLRTFLSSYINFLDGTLVRAVVTQDAKGLAWGLVAWLAIGLPATFTNSMIKFFEARLALSFRTHLTSHALKQYMKADTYYAVGNLDNRLSNPDQCLTEDIDRFCTQLAYLHSHLSKPIFDIIYFTYLITQHVGWKAMTGAWVMVALSGKIVRVFTPPFGSMVARKAELEGEYRYLHSRLIANAEEVAFYKGHDIEKDYIQDAYTDLEEHMKVMFMARVAPGVLESWIMKYLWNAFGFIMSAAPIMSKGLSSNQPAGAMVEQAVSNVKANLGQNTQTIVTTRRLMASGADACLDVLSAYKEVAELAGYTERVSQMLLVFEDVQAGRHVKGRATPEGGAPLAKQAEGGPQPDSRLVEAAPGILRSVQGGAAGWGTVDDTASFIGLDRVPIVTPNQDVLVAEMSLSLKPGMHVLITGPNGCGKSSLFRILGGLWPTFGGTLRRPKPGDMFYIPQRPYLSIGTLREQVIYPMSTLAFFSNGTSNNDAHLDAILNDVELKYLVAREGGWGACNDWKDVLSGGEKQKVAMARLLFHRPKFAILDECTSAVAIDVEGAMYMKAKEYGITLMTVSHRSSLWKFHDYLLEFDGSGHYHFSKLGGSGDTGEGHVYLKIGDEKQKIEATLAKVPGLKARLQELKEMQARLSTDAQA